MQTERAFTALKGLSLTTLSAISSAVLFFHSSELNLNLNVAERQEERMFIVALHVMLESLLF